MLGIAIAFLIGAVAGFSLAVWFNSESHQKFDAVTDGGEEVMRKVIDKAQKLRKD